MFEQYKYKIELHSHSSGISLCSDISALDMIRYYRESGYQGLVITNHFYPWMPKNNKKYKKYQEDYIDEYYTLRDFGERSGIMVYLGMEIRFEENDNDYLLYGIDEDFVRAVPRECQCLEDFIPFVREYPDVLLIQAHPFRNGMVIKDSSLLDGIEVYNLHPNHNSRVGLAAKYAEMEEFEVCTCGTDFHHLGQHGLTALLTKELPEDEKELVKCMKEEQIYKIGKSTVVF